MGKTTVLRLWIFAATTVAVLTWAHSVSATSTISVQPQNASVDVGRTIPLQVVVDSAGASINVVSAAIQYPTELLDVVEVSRGQSFLTLWPDLPTVDTAQGMIRFSGGIPNGTVAHAAPAVTILFRAKVRGVATVNVVASESAIYRNDGLGTQDTLTARFATVTAVDHPSFVPVLLSSSHPDEAAWSQLRSITVSWDRHEQSFYSYLLSPDADVVPDELADDPVSSVTYPNVSDGVWYFALREKIGDDPWGPTARYRFMIDGTAPDSLTAERVFDDESKVWLLSMNAVDATSGIAGFTVTEEDLRFAFWPFALRKTTTATTTPYQLRDQENRSNVTITATDNAGNTQVLRLASQELVEQQRWLLAGYGALVLCFIGAMIAVVCRRARHEGGHI